MKIVSVGTAFPRHFYTQDELLTALAEAWEGHLFNLPGVMIQIKPQRYYLYKELAAHLNFLTGNLFQQVAAL